MDHRVDPWFRILDVDTMRTTTRNRLSTSTVVRRLYATIARHPHSDFVIVDEGGNPVPASAFRKWVA